MKIPPPTISIQSLIDAYHESKAEPPRPHMGCSQLGNPCDRALWLSFRWAVYPKFSGRILRVFRRGQNEEATIVDDLEAIGMDIWHTGADQISVKFGAHVSGSLDGIIKSGVPEAPSKQHIAEFKTHSKKSFDQVVKEGVAKSKPTHYIQMQCYMLGTKIDRALYVAICKDNDEIYTERVRFDKEVAEKYIHRGQSIALSDTMPAPLSTDPSWYQCKFCDFHSFCFKTKLTENVNCRTCAHSTALENSTWRCELHESNGIPVDFQRTGCESHVLHPDLVPWERKPRPDDGTAVYVIDGKDVLNGHGDSNVYSSHEILANPSACASGMMDDLREEFEGRVVG